MLPTSYGRLVCLWSAGLRQSSVLGLTLWSTNSLGSVLFPFGAGGSYYAAGCGFGVCWTSGRCVMHYIRIRLTPSWILGRSGIDGWWRFGGWGGVLLWDLLIISKAKTIKQRIRQKRQQGTRDHHNENQSLWVKTFSSWSAGAQWCEMDLSRLVDLKNEKLW